MLSQCSRSAQVLPALVLLNPKSRLTNISNLLGYKGVPGREPFAPSQKLQSISTGKGGDRQGEAELVAAWSGQQLDSG